jgi:chromosome segregation ATPase
LPPQQQQQRSLPSSGGAGIGSSDANVVEQLQYLYRWLLENDDRGDDEDENIRSNRWNQSDSANELVHMIQNNVELRVAKMQEIQQELSACKGDLRAKEEGNEEMRNSLKEAVSLLRPLQDTVTKMDKEKNKYLELYQTLREEHDACLLELRRHKQTINTKEDEMEQMKQEIESLELQLSKAKLAVANSVAAQHAGVANRSVEMDVEALDEKRAKRRSGENNIKELLRDAQSRDIAGFSGADIYDSNDALEELRNELSRKESEIADLESKLSTANQELEDLRESAGPDRDRTDEVEQLQLQVRSMEDELKETKRLLGTKRDAERALNKSLKDALGLIKPLQIHLEESENEKRQMMKELEAYQRAPGNGSVVSRREPQMSASSGLVGPAQNAVSFEAVRELESTVRQLEKENAMLQDALEDMSQSLNASHVSGTNYILSPNNPAQLQPKFVSTSSKKTPEGKRLHQEFVELQSRYEVTQSRLNEAYSENRSLREQLSLSQMRVKNSQK